MKQNQDGRDGGGGWAQYERKEGAGGRCCGGLGRRTGRIGNSATAPWRGHGFRMQRRGSRALCDRSSTRRAGRQLAMARVAAAGRWRAYYGVSHLCCTASPGALPGRGSRPDSLVLGP